MAEGRLLLVLIIIKPAGLWAGLRFNNNYWEFESHSDRRFILLVTKLQLKFFLPRTVIMAPLTPTQLTRPFQPTTTNLNWIIFKNNHKPPQTFLRRSNNISETVFNIWQFSNFFKVPFETAHNPKVCHNFQTSLKSRAFGAPHFLE